MSPWRRRTVQGQCCKAWCEEQLRGRPGRQRSTPSPTSTWQCGNTPELTVEKLAQAAHVTIPGEGEKRENRLAGLGPLSGLAPGIGVGALLGAGYAARRTPGPVAGTLLCSIVVLLSANAPMTLLGIADPRIWSAADWASDIVPHLAYGATVHGVLASYDN